MASGVTVHTLTSERLEDAVAVFEDVGAAAKCWCAYWRLSNAAYQAGAKSGANRAAFCDRVASGEPTGLVAYVAEQPAGWCSVAPRRLFDRLNRSKPLAEIDARAVWTINCFTIRKAHRRAGVATALLSAAVEHARAAGAPAVEAYPVDKPKLTSYETFTGTVSMFAAAGFVEVARRLPTRPIMRLELERA